MQFLKRWYLILWLCREHCLAAKHLLQQGKNTLDIVIHPASKAAKRRYDAYPYEVPTMYVSPWTDPLSHFILLFAAVCLLP